MDDPNHPDYLQNLRISYQNAQEKLKKYNDLTDYHHELYAAATFLNPYLKKPYFIDRWTGNTVNYIDEMIEKNRSIQEEKYKEEPLNETQEEIRVGFEAFLRSTS